MFRDILLQNSALAEEYSQLKINLAKEKGMTKELYTKRISINAAIEPGETPEIPWQYQRAY